MARLTVNATKVLERRYLLKDKNGKVVETPSQMFRRIARSIAKTKKAQKDYLSMLESLEFLPNSPTIMNAGTPLRQLSACFVLPVEDSIEGIFTSVKTMALIHQSGGGTGFSFSHLRPEGDVVRSTGGVASGPVSFMRVFDTATEVVKQGGRRRGANMGILNVNHPDILKFINAKRGEAMFRNFNISVSVTDSFMKAVERKSAYNLVSPRTKKVVGRLNAAKVFDEIVFSAWETGDPGIVFIDEINRKNPTRAVGKIESTNPCGEQPLVPYESCNLGSINLSLMLKEGNIDWERLERAVKLAVQFLDDVIDANLFPTPQIEKVTRQNRRIGLGVMGFAEMLIQLGIPYDSDKALKVAERLMEFINKKAHEASSELAGKRGSFPNFSKSTWRKRYKRLRNATVTTIAPTGTISIIAGTSSGIEPLFAVSFIRNIMEGTELLEVNPLFEKIAKERGFYSKGLISKIARTGSVQNIKEVPEDVRRVFVTALDISPKWHVRMQAAFQKYTDNAVSKTVNLPENATIGDVKRAYLLAHKLNCKGITVFRYGSRTGMPLVIRPMLRKEAKYVKADSEYTGDCRVCSV